MRRTSRHYGRVLGFGLWGWGGLVVLLSMIQAIAGPTGALEQQTAPPQSDPDRQAILDRLQQLQSVAVRFDWTQTYTPRDLGPARPNKPNRYRGSWTSHAVFRFLDGRAWYEDELDQRTSEFAQKEIGPSTRKRYIFVYTHERAERFTQAFDDPLGFAVIVDDIKLPFDASMDVALGLRHRGQEGWLDAKTLEPAKIQRTPGGLVLASLDVKAGSSIVVHKWTFDPARAFALVSYSAALRGMVFHEMDCTDFGQVGKLYLPYKVNTRGIAFGKEGDPPHVAKSDEMRVHEYVLNDPANTPDSFRIVYAKGTGVGDRRLGVQMKTPTTGPVTDEELIERARQKSGPLMVESGPPSAMFWYAGGLAAVVGLGTVVWFRQQPRAKHGAGE